MTSQLNVDTIVDKAGSGGTNVKIGNTSTYVSDGGAVTQNTVQGLAKAWVNFNGTGTIATRDSFNTASLTDGGSGNYDVNWTNNFGNTNYSFVGSDGNYGMTNTEPQNLSTNEANIFSYNNSHALTDTHLTGVANGDLA